MLNGLFFYAQCTERMKSNLPDKMVYPDDFDFITKLEQKRRKRYIKEQRPY